MRKPREPFGKAGLTVAICALVLALVGGAYAAGGLTKSQEKQVTKIAKKYAGKPGATGPAGAAGTNGTNGKDGSNGTPGNPGKSVVTSAAAVPGECPNGTTGTKFEVEGSGSPSHVCNGKNGVTGFTKTLPSRETETGSWSLSVQDAEPELYFVPISFNIPLEEGLDEGHVHYVAKETSGGSACPGTVEEPKALEGNLCVYETTLTGSFGTLQAGAPENGILKPSGVPGAGTTGAAMFFGGGAVGKFDFGTWAVTAAE